MKTKIIKILSLAFVGFSIVSCSNSTNLFIKENANDLVQNETATITTDEIILNKAISNFYDHYSAEFKIQILKTGIPEVDNGMSYESIGYTYIYQNGEKEEIHYCDHYSIIDGQMVEYPGTQVFYDKESGYSYVESLALDNTIQKEDYGYIPNKYNALINPFFLLNPLDFEKNGEYYICTNEMKFSFLRGTGLGGDLFNSMPVTDLKFKIENNHFVSATGNAIAIYFQEKNYQYFKMPLTITFHYDNLKKLEHLKPLVENEDQKKLTKAFQNMKDKTYIITIEKPSEKFIYYRGAQSVVLMKDYGATTPEILEDLWWVRSDDTTTSWYSMLKGYNINDEKFRYSEYIMNYKEYMYGTFDQLLGVFFDYNEGVYTNKSIVYVSTLFNCLPNIFREANIKFESSMIDMKIKIENDYISEIKCNDTIFKFSSIGNVTFPFDLDDSKSIYDYKQSN